mmetsp:Transcript_3276/g.7089  ORF Transcript_3276/g.7089 Transcript_3276/m.7089 type:complete len:270 (-) Transcript_3276:329-1138(-)
MYGVISSSSGYSTKCESFPRPNGTYAKRFSCNAKTLGGSFTVNCFDAFEKCGFADFPSHLYLLSPSRTSVTVNALNAPSTDLHRTTSNERSKNESNVSLLRPHVLQFTCERNLPPKTFHKNVVSLLGEFGFNLGLTTSTHRLCIASSKHRTNSCASSCLPLRNVLDSALRFLTNVIGAMVRPLEFNARTMCSPSSYNALNEFSPPPRVWNFLCSPLNAKCANAGVCVRHCNTAFKKHVFPRLANPAPARRGAFHVIRTSSNAYKSPPLS